MANALIARPSLWPVAPACPPGACSQRPRRTWTHLLVGFAAGALSVAALAHAAATQSPRLLRTSAPAEARETYARELPRESRWTPPSVSVEHMFRSKR